jgi:hypothetical protein
MSKLSFALAAAAVLIVLPGSPAAAAAFCAYASGVAGYENCHYYTFEQCLAAVSGAGGLCMRNPHDPALWAVPAPPPPPRKHRHHPT